MESGTRMPGSGSGRLGRFAGLDVPCSSTGSSSTGHLTQPLPMWISYTEIIINMRKTANARLCVRCFLYRSAVSRTINTAGGWQHPLFNCLFADRQHTLFILLHDIDNNSFCRSAGRMQFFTASFLTFRSRLLYASGLLLGANERGWSDGRENRI